MAGSYKWQPSFAGGVLGPGLHGRVDLAKYGVGLKTGKNVIIHAHGGFSNRPGTRFVAGARYDQVEQRLIPFERDEVTTYALAFNNGFMRVIDRGQMVMSGAAVYELSVPYISAQLAAVNYVQSIDVMYLAHSLHAPRKLLHYAKDNWAIDLLMIEPDITPDDWLNVPASGGSAPENLRALASNSGSNSVGFNYPRKKYDYSYAVVAIYAAGDSRSSGTATVKNYPPGVYGPGSEQFIVRNRISWTAAPGATGYKVYKMFNGRFRLAATLGAATSWDDTLASTGSSGAFIPAQLTVAAANSGSETYSYVVSPIIDGVEGQPSEVGIVENAQRLNEDGAKNTLTWPGKAQEYNIYREYGGIFGYIGFSNKPTFVDNNIAPDTNRTPREPSTIFSAAGDYPSVVTIMQQRLIWAASINQPETIWGSVIGNYEDYTKSKITVADDRIEMDISGEKLNRITGLTGLQQLVAFTGSGEYGVGSNDGTLSATQPAQQRYGSSGSSGVRPLMVGDSVLYVDRSGRLVRDLRYSFEADGYAGNDLSILAHHYFVGRQVVDWAYCHAPFGLVWVVLDNGVTLSLTYKREQEVWAWTEHDFGGKVESVCSINEDGYDALYLSVVRQINGVQRRFIERMCNRQLENDPMDACFLDAAVTYKGAATSTITGLGHLNGMTVNALADGDVVNGLVVSGGQVTLPRAASHVHVGLPYVSTAETLPLYVDLQGTGASRGLPVKATEAFLQLENTRGVEIGVQDVAGQMSGMVQTIYDLSESIPLFTGLWRFDLFPEFNDRGTIIVKQSEPLPMTVLGISPKWTIGR